MKKLGIILFIFLIFIPLAEAKTILFVTKESTDSPCSLLSQEEKLYCEEIVNLGYDVKVINEKHVKENSQTWKDYSSASEMIFLGEISLDMVNKSEFQDIFCGNLSLANKKLFLAFSSTKLNKTMNIEGCAFHPSIAIANFSYDDNVCIKKTFKVAKEGYITEGYSLGDNIDLYSLEREVKIHDISSDAWLTAECVPPNGPIDFYPVISLNEKGVFWGLDNPSNFTKDAWNIFDKTLLQAMGDTTWFIDAFTIPTVVTAGKPIWILANVTQLGKQVNGTVNFTADGVSGPLNYEKGLWKNTNVMLPEEKTYTLTINAYSPSGLRGTFALSITAGNLNVNIDSGNYKPNSPYTIKATLSANFFIETAQANYKIRDPETYEVLFSGPLACQENECVGYVDKMPDVKSLILEVTAFSNNIGGGSFKIIQKEPITTNKDLYKPGEMIVIEFFPPEPIGEANLTIIKPDGIFETPTPIPMERISASHWGKNYTLGKAALNGTYTIKVKASKINETIEFEKKIDVITWKPFAYLNKYSFNIYEVLKLTVKISDCYSDLLDFSIKAKILDPEGKLAYTATGSIKGNGNFETEYLIPGDYKSGVSRVEVEIVDSYERNATLHLNFSMNYTAVPPSLHITPPIISKVTISGKTIEEKAFIENSAENVDVTNLLVNVSSTLANIVKIKSQPKQIPAKSRGELIFTISTAGLSEGTYSGSINFLSQVGSAQLTINIEIIRNLYLEAENKLSEIGLIERNITYLKEKWVNVSEALVLLNETKSLFESVKSNYENENYEDAKSKFEEANTKLSSLKMKVSELYTKIPDYSFIIWDFAIAIILIIIGITVFKYRKKIKEALKKREKEEVEEIYYMPEDYRTEYY